MQINTSSVMATTADREPVGSGHQHSDIGRNSQQMLRSAGPVQRPTKPAVAGEFALQLAGEFEQQLRLTVEDVLTLPGFTQVQIEFTGSATQSRPQQWLFSLGVSPLSNTHSGTGHCECQLAGRWQVRVQASYVRQWLADPEAQLEVEVLTGQLQHLLAALQVRQQIRQQYQSTQYWYGYSRSIRALEGQLKQYANLRVPLLLLGEQGTGKLPAALSLHCYRYAEPAAFVQTDCRTWLPGSAAQHLAELAGPACDGSLYLAHTECLQAVDQLYLRDFVTHHAGHCLLILGYRTAAGIDALPCAANADFAAWADFHCVSLQLPRLQQRVQDIRPFIHCYLAEHQLSLQLTPQVLEVLQRYSWPENACQLQSVLKKAASLTTAALSVDQLFDWFPSLQCQPRPLLHNDDQASPPAAIAPATDTPVTSAPANTASLQQRRHSLHLWFGFSQPAQEHPALLRALEHIWKHYPQPLALNTVAAKACVSPSHLSFLFKQRLQRSFKQILTEIRIDKAKHIFENMPARQITQVCIDVGFADLSHFEKTFKRVVGLKPRCYRQQFRQPLSTQS